MALPDKAEVTLVPVVVSFVSVLHRSPPSRLQVGERDGPRELPRGRACDDVLIGLRASILSWVQIPPPPGTTRANAVLEAGRSATVAAKSYRLLRAVLNTSTPGV
jgi:hypothetical protein